MASEEMLSRLRQFVHEHPGGWNHDDWLGLLFQLSQEGIHTWDEDAIGLALERERLNVTLDSLDIRGLGPKRREAIGDRFGSIWNLLAASPEDVASVPGIPGKLAEEILEILR